MDECSETLAEDGLTDDGLAEAAAVVLDAAEAGDGTVTWGDVSDDLPAEQWGRLLESGLLVATEADFVVDDPDAVRAAVADSETAIDPDAGADSDDEGWSTADRIAGVCALGLMASYQVPMARDTVGSTAHLLFGPVEAVLPFGATVAVLAIATTLLSTTLRGRFTGDSQRERLTERMERVRVQLSDARERGDSEAIERLQARQRELLGEQLGLFREMLRPMVWTMLVTVPVFLWLSWLTVNPAAAITPAAQILPFAGRVVWTARLVGPMQVWMVWYFVCSVLSSVVGKRVGERVAGRLKPVVAG